MSKIKISRIWGFYFFIGFFVLQLHLLRYLNSFLTGYTPWADKYIDYGFISREGFFIRLICFIAGLFLFKIKNLKPITATTLVWTISFILLSNEHELFTFLGMLIICIVCYSSCIYLFFKNKN